MAHVSRNNQRGSVVVLVAVTLIMLIGFVALVVDIGHLYLVRGELQNSSDSAAHAAAQMLDRTPAGIAAARATAIAYAAQHAANGAPVAVAPSDVIFGYWDEADGTFTSFGTDPANPAQVNAVRVTTRRTDATGDAVAPAFAQIIGIGGTDVTANAVGLGGGPSTECTFPMVVPDCSLDEAIAEYDGGKYCDFCMKMENALDDTAAWSPLTVASGSAGGVGAQVFAELIDSACFDAAGNPNVDPVTGLCSGGCNELTVAEEVSTNNGNFFNQTPDGPCNLIEQLLLRDGEPAKAFTVMVPVLQSSPGTCDAQDFSGTATDIAGFATVEIFGVKCGNSAEAVLDEEVAFATDCSTSSGKWVLGALRCDLESDNGVAGGAYYGVDAKHIRLVQ